MNKLEEIKKEVSRKKRNLDKFFGTEYNKVLQDNIKNGLGRFNIFVQWSKDETSSQHGGEEAMESDGLKIWKSNVWVNTTDRFDGIEVIDDRIAIPSISMWYSPFHYNNEMSIGELYDKSEKEKVLYECCDVKVSWVRRNVIPFFNSVQYCHKMSEPEYIMYIKRKKEDNDVNERIKVLIEEMKGYLRNGESVPQSIIDEKEKLSNSLYYWHECVHGDTIKQLFTRAGKYFNDWY